MGERKTISSSFSVNTIEDATVYEITSSVSSVTVESDTVSTTLYATLNFYKRVGDNRTAYSCYATLFRKKGNSIYAYNQNNKATSWTINQGVPSASYDAVVVRIYNERSTADTEYLAELVIPVIKNGDTGKNGMDGAGSEWVYIRSKTNTPPVIRDDDNYPDSNGKDYEDDEYLPKVVGNSNTEIGNSGDITNHPYECNDDAKGVSETWPYEWKAKRMKLLNQAGTAREWQKYYDATGSTHAMSLASNWSKDGKDAATLVFEPAVVVFRADSNGNVLSGQTFFSMVTLMLPNGTTATPTLSNGNASTDADCSDSGRTITVSVDEDGYTASDIEGYYAVTGTANIGGVTYVAKGSLKITVARDGENGPRGNTGPMSYLAGEYDATVNYGALLTDTGCPVVHYSATNEYWYPTEDYRGAGYPPSVANGWQKADNFEVVVTKVLFTQFAKLGGFVVSGDFMLSQYGELFDADGNSLALTQQTDADGSTHWRYQGVDAYTYFRDYDPMAKHAVLPILVRNNWQYWSSYLTTNGEIYITMNSSDVNYTYLKSIAVGDNYYLCGTDQNGEYHCLLMRKSRAVGTNNRLYGYREEIIYDYAPDPYTGSSLIFRPAKVANAVTGEEWMAGGKVHVTGDGDVTIEGTVKAKNLYHGVCVFIEGGIYSTQWYYVAGTSDWISSKGLSIGDYVEITDAMRAEAYFESTNLLPCTYDADIISMNPNGSANWGSSNDAKTVVLPDPKDFPGKIVEVTSFNYGISAKTAYVGCVVENAFALKVAYNSTSKTVINDTGASVSSITISTGSPIRLLSIYASNQYWWLRIQ